MKPKELILFSLFVLVMQTQVISQETGRGVEILFSEKNESRNVRAVIVGVSAYKNLKNQLQYAHADAISFYKMLTAIDGVNKENITMLLNEQAKREQVMLALKTMLINLADSNDLLIFYFAGHGDIEPEIPDDGYLLCYDAPENRGYDINGGLVLTNLQKWVKKANEKGAKVLIITDACRSGKLIEDGKGAQMTLLALQTTWSNTIKFVSCDPDQSSYEGKDWGGGHGVYTYYLVKGWSGEADIDKDKTITAKELQRWVEDTVSKATKEKQSPIFSGDSKTRIIEYEKTLTAEIFLNNNSETFASSTKKRGIKSIQMNATEKEIIDQFRASLKGGKLLPKDDKTPFNFTEQINIQETDKTQVTEQNENCVAVNKETGLIASGSSDKNLRLWEMDNETNKLNSMFQIGPHEGIVKSVFFSTNEGFVFSLDQTGQLYYWNLNTKSLVYSIKPQHTKINSVSCQKNGNLFATLEGSSLVKIYDSEDFKLNKFDPKYTLANLPDINQIQFSVDDGFIIGWNDHDVFRIEKKRYLLYKKIISTTTEISAVCSFDNDNFLALGDSKGTISIVDVAKQEIIHKIKLGTKINSMTLDATGLFLFVSSFNHQTYVVRLSDLSVINQKIKTNQSVTSLCFNPSQNLLIASTFCFDDGRKSWLHAFNCSVSFTIPDNAYDILQVIKKIGVSKDIKFGLQAQLSAFLLDEANQVLMPLINGRDISPSIDSINYAIRNLDYACKLYEGDMLMNESTIARKLLLEVYKILLTNDLYKANYGLSLLDSISKLETYATFPLNTKGLLYKQINDLENAKSSVNKAMYYLPKWTEPKATFGKTLILEGKFDSAISEFKKITEIEPTSSKGYTNLGIAYSMKGDYENSEKNFLTALKMDKKNPYIYSEFARMKIQSGDNNSASSILKKCLESFPDYVPALLVQCDMNLSMGNYMEAEKSLNTTLKLDSVFSGTWAKLAYLELCRGNITNSKIMLEKCYKYDNFNADYYILSSLYYKKRYFEISHSSSDLDSMFNFLIKSEKIAPFSYNVLNELIKTYFQLVLDCNEYNNYNSNFLFTNKTIEEQKKYLIGKLLPLCERTLLAAPNKKLGRAIIEFSKLFVSSEKKLSNQILKIVENYPNEASILYFGGLTAEKLGFFQEAQSYYLKSINLMGSNSDCWFHFLKVALKTNQSLAMKNETDEYLKLNKPRLPEIYRNIAYASKLNKLQYNFYVTQGKAVDKSYFYLNMFLEIYSDKKGKSNLKNNQISFNKYETITEDFFKIKSADNQIGILRFDGTIILPMNFEKIELKNNFFISTNKSGTFIFDQYGDFFSKQ